MHGDGECTAVVNACMASGAATGLRGCFSPGEQHHIPPGSPKPSCTPGRLIRSPRAGTCPPAGSAAQPRASSAASAAAQMPAAGASSPTKTRQTCPGPGRDRGRAGSRPQAPSAPGQLLNVQEPTIVTAIRTNKYYRPDLQQGLFMLLWQGTGALARGDNYCYVHFSGLFMVPEQQKEAVAERGLGSLIPLPL